MGPIGSLCWYMARTFIGTFWDSHRQCSTWRLDNQFIHKILTFMDIFLIDSWDESKIDKQINIPRQRVSFINDFVPLDWLLQTDCWLIEGTGFHLFAFVTQTIVITRVRCLTHLNSLCFLSSVWKKKRLIDRNRIRWIFGNQTFL